MIDPEDIMNQAPTTPPPMTHTASTPSSPLAKRFAAMPIIKNKSVNSNAKKRTHQNRASQNIKFCDYINSEFVVGDHHETQVIDIDEELMGAGMFTNTAAKMSSAPASPPAKRHKIKLYAATTTTQPDIINPVEAANSESTEETLIFMSMDFTVSPYSKFSKDEVEFYYDVIVQIADTVMRQLAQGVREVV
ncbi:hypothetical protein HDU76_013514 [Blyttiomyces sp. JEL0837]|nr:hypothetical protein HDU76_013514 [Blyttiomyces sp. JEL0837]